MNKTLLNDLPEFITSKVLVELGLYPTISACRVSRHKGTSPSYLKIGRKILYPRESVLEFINKNFKDGSLSTRALNGN
jgi:hypothetical protein